MEEFETKVINTTTYPPKLWFRYVDDTFVIQKVEHRIHFLEHLSSIDPHTQFPMKTPNIDGSINFLDTLVSPGAENTLLAIFHRKGPKLGQPWQLIN